MCDAPDLLCDPFHATLEHDDLLLDASHPITPVPDRSRPLRRTISCASIDTVRPPKKKGIRRSIEEIAENLKHKKKKDSGTQEVSKLMCDDMKLVPKPRSSRKAAKRTRRAAPLLQDTSHKSEEDSVLAIADRLHSGVPCDLDPLLMVSGHKTESLIDVPLFKEDDEDWEPCALPVRTPGLGVHFTTERQDDNRSPPIVKGDGEDVQLQIKPSETDLTIWDGLESAHHVYKCRLFLRCTAHPYDSVSLPDIGLVEMECNTRPIAGSAYARPPAWCGAYDGAAPGLVTNQDEPPNIKLAAGIHMDRVWCRMQDDDGAWGWYRDAFVPLSSRLFDKMDYREFKLVSRVWMGETFVEDELTFGISMLLRGVDMK